MRIVVDTNVFFAAILGRGGGASRHVLRSCLAGDLEPLMGTALFLEYEDVTKRPQVTTRSPLTSAEIDALLDAFLSVCRWVTIYYGWRPNLRDEGDEHLIELAVAGGAEAIVTRNVRDLESGDLRFERLRVVTPTDLVTELLKWRR